MEEITASPLVGVGGVKFGMAREEVRKKFGTAKEFKKTKVSTTTTDDFGFCHVYYNKENACEAIEIFGDTKVMIRGKQVFPGNIQEARKVLGTLKMEKDNFIAQNISVGIHTPGGKMKSILFGVKGYYEKE